MSPTNGFHACFSEHALVTPNILSLQLCQHIFFIFFISHVLIFVSMMWNKAVSQAGFSSPRATSFAQAGPPTNQFHSTLKFRTAWSPAKQRCESVIQMTGSVIACSHSPLNSLEERPLCVCWRRREFSLEVVLRKQKAAELLLHFPLHRSRVFF